MITSIRGRKPANWAVAVTKQGISEIMMRMEEGMEEKLATLRKKWETGSPDDEFTIMLKDTEEAVYVGRFPEGIVLRLNDKDDHVTFLTSEMASALGEKLLGRASG